MATKKKTSKRTSPPYTASIKLFGKLYTAQGKTPTEAITKLSPGMARGVAVLSVSNGVIAKERILSSMATTKLFNSVGLSREVALKNVSTMFNGI